MSRISSAINRRLSVLLGYDPITKLKIYQVPNLERIGTEYGGWVIPQNVLKESSVCYLAGAGEDISFDAGIVEKHGCEVCIFDPTPKAVKHFEKFEATISAGDKMPINNNLSRFYDLKKEKLSRLHFYDLGLWDKEEVIKFYVPKNPEHASHSILNIQKTESYVEAKVDRLSGIMKRQGHQSVDLLKIDIDGAEYKVLQSVIEDQLNIGVICIEYDEAIFSLDKDYLKRIKKSLRDLMKFRYVIVHGNQFCNYTLVKKSLLGTLNK